MPVRASWFETSICNARKGHEIVACVGLQGDDARPVNRRRMSTILFFVRVNQVLVRLWARVIGASALV